MQSDVWIVLFVVAINVVALTLGSRRDLKVATGVGNEQR
jgi:hypothetical protein